MKRRILALLLVCTMLMSVFPVLALEGNEPGPGNEIIVEPGPVEPGPVEPGPVEPGPVEPGPVEPGPVEPGPVEPGPVEPGPVEPGPVEPGPVEPGPVEPGPVEPGPVEPGPVEPAELDLYTQLMAAETVDAFDALLAALTEEDIDSFFESLTEEQIEAIDEHLAALFAAETVSEPEEDDAFIEHVPNIIHPALDFTNAAPLMPPLSVSNAARQTSPKNSPKFSIARSLMNTTAAPATNDGLELSKELSQPDADGVYTLKLEAYATGNKIVTPTTKVIPTDIVLVLDQSGSMSYNMNTMGYQTVSGTPAQLYDKRDSLFVSLDGGGYSQVTVNRSTYYPYTTRANNTNSSNFSDKDYIYHQASDGTYHKITVIRAGPSGSRQYTYTCSRGDWGPKNSQGMDTTPPFAEELYRRGSSDGYQYTFTYTDELGTNISETVRESANAPSWAFYETYVTSTVPRLDALVDAVNSFAGSVKDKAETDNVNHRIAIVGFSSDNYNNTELLTGVNITTNSNTNLQENDTKYYPNNEQRNGVQYGSITDAQYANALQDMQTSAGQTNVTNAINALTAHGGTQTLDGLTMAEDIFINSPVSSGETRNRVVILFTDGETNSDRTDTIAKANALKNTYGATVFSVGIFDDANGTPPAQTGDSNQTNRLMHLISSNYPNASGDGSSAWGALNPNLTNGASYYLSAGNANGLNEAFKTIVEQIEGDAPDVELGANAIVRDVITPYFQLAGTEADSITAYDVAYLGNGTWSSTHGTSYTPSYNTGTQTIDVSGFDFKNNYKWDNSAVNPSFGGKKLVIEVKIKAKDAFWGGNNVPTNGAGSGVYEDASHTSSVESFPLPQANVPLKTPTVTGVNYNIYAGNPAPTHEQLINVTEIPTGWETAYVTVVRSPNPISNLESGTHTVTVTITPQDAAATSVGAPAEPWSGSASATVTVFKPVVTFKDSAVNQGEALAGYDYNTHNLGIVTWMNGTNPAPTSMGPAPTLTYTYAPGTTETTFQTDTDVCVTSVKNGDVDIKSVTSFAWQTGGSTACPADEADPNPTNQFCVHVIRPVFNLTITKTVTGGTPTQSFIFDITGANDFSMSVVLSPDKFANGNTASVTIYGLPSGSYTVTERGNWSWQYELSGENNQEVSGEDNHAEFSNSRKAVYWLGDAAITPNIFAVKGKEEVESE